MEGVMNQIPQKKILKFFFDIFGFYRNQNWPLTTFFQVRICLDRGF